MIVVSCMQLKYNSSTVWKCVGEKRDGRKKEKRRKGRPRPDDDSNAHTFRERQTVETDLGGKSYSGTSTEDPKRCGRLSPSLHAQL